MTRPTFVWNGVDYSKKINCFSYSVTPTPRSGNNGGIMQNGDRRPDVLKWADVVTVETNGLKGSDVAALLTAMKVEKGTLKYLSSSTNAERTATFIPSIGTVRYAFIKSGSVVWYNGFQITLEEV